MGVTIPSNHIRMRFGNGYKSRNMIPLDYDKEYAEMLTLQDEKADDGQKYVMVVSSGSEKHPVR